MSALLVPAVIDRIRSQFTPKEVAVVQAYGGEFSGAEIGKVTFSCPAIFVTSLGWRQAENGKRLTGRGVRRARMACFVVTAGGKRDQRMLAAAALAERLCNVIAQWSPPNPDEQAYTLAALEEDPAAENLYSRMVDDKGLALWLVDWHQSVKPDPNLTTPQFYDLVRVEITDITRQGVIPGSDAPDPGGVVPVVTEDIQFTPIPDSN